jgi:hypothetical protein
MHLAPGLRQSWKSHIDLQALRLAFRIRAQAQESSLGVIAHHLDLEATSRKPNVDFLDTGFLERFNC